MSIALKPTPAVDYENKMGLIDAIQKLNSYGITSAVDARAYWQRGNDKIWKDVRDHYPQDFTIRAVLDLWAAPELKDANQLSEIRKRYEDNDDLLRVTGVKVSFVDE